MSINNGSELPAEVVEIIIRFRENLRNGVRVDIVPLPDGTLAVGKLEIENLRKNRREVEVREPE